MQITMTDGQLAILVSLFITLIGAIVALIRIFWVNHTNQSERILTLELQQKNFGNALVEIKSLIEKQEKSAQEKIDRVSEKLEDLKEQLFHAGYPIPVRAIPRVAIQPKETNQ